MSAQFPGGERVKDMLAVERDAKLLLAARETTNGRPWKFEVLCLGVWTPEASFATEAEAKAELSKAQSTCAPFIRNALRVHRDPGAAPADPPTAWLVILGAVSNEASYYGPYGTEEIAGRARDSLAKQGHEGIVRPLHNGLAAYAEMRAEVR